MSWLGDSISSLTGQLTNFTKEVLSEGREEVSDHAAELNVVQQKARELEIQCMAQKQEVNRTHATNKELDDRANAAELQINSLTREYRSLLQQKEDEISRLRQQQLEMEEMREKMLSRASSGGLGSPGYQSGGGSSCGAFSNVDEMDFGDVISSQHEINRLSDTVHRLRAERDYWKRLVSSAPSTKGLSDFDNLQPSNLPDSRTIHQLETNNKELETRLHQIIDKHQKEQSAVQDACSEKINQLKKSYQSQICDLQRQLGSFTTNVGPDSADEEASQLQLRQQCSQLHIDLERRENELEDVRGTLRERERTVQLLGRQLEKLQAEKVDLVQSQDESEKLQEIISNFKKSEAELQQRLNLSEETLRSQELLIAQMKSNENEDTSTLKSKLEAAEAKISELLHEYEQASNSEMLLEVQLARHKFANKSDARQTQLLKEKQDLANRMAQVSMRGVDVQGNVSTTQEEYEARSDEVRQLIEKLGDPEHQQLIAGIIHTLELENNILKEQNLDLEKRLCEQISEKAEATHDKSENVSRKSTRESKSRSNSRVSDRSTPARSTDDQMFEFDDCETASVMSSYSELSQRNKELDDQLKTLQSQIDTYERDIEQFEMVKADWQSEREALEELLNKTRSELRAKETSLTLVTAQRGLLEVKKKSPRPAREKQEETELNFGQELENLQEQIEELSQGSVLLENERDLLLIEKEQIFKDLCKVNKLNEDLQLRLSQSESNSVDRTQMQDVIRDLESNMQALVSERDLLLSSLEELDKQHQTAIEHILQSRNSAQQNLKETQNTVEKLEEQLQVKTTEVNASQEIRRQLEGEVKRISGLEDEIAKSHLRDDELIEIHETLQEKLEKQKRQLDEAEKDKNAAMQELLAMVHKPEVTCDSWIEISGLIIGTIRERDNEIKNLEKQVESIQENKTDIEHDLELSHFTIESFQTESAISKDDRNRNLWDMESWEDIVDEATKNEKDNNLIKSTTKLQDMEFESTSSKHSKDSSDDGQEKYGELVQRKEDLELQIKELELQVNEQQQEKEKFILADDLATVKKDIDGLLNNEKMKLDEKLEKVQQTLTNFELNLNRVQEQVAKFKEESTVNKKSGFEKLRLELNEKTKQLAAMSDILRVYKENFDPDKIEDTKPVETEDEKMKLCDEKERQIQQLQEELNDALKKTNEKEKAWWTEDQYRNLQREKEQILSVLNEKSRENSSLKGEVHRLTSIVAAERCALDKLQQDTQILLKQKEIGQAEASEMTKETVQNMRRIIRDKELEVEALSQKNNTLIAVLQQSPSVEGNQLQTILEERENLTKQIGQYLNEREQIIAALHQKHQESTAYHAEIQRLMSALYNEHQKFDNLEQQHTTIAKQYEDKQKSLLNTQNEMISLKQRVTELEEQQLDLKEKYTQLLEKENNNSKAEKIEIPKAELKAMEEELRQLTKSNQDKDQWLFEKDKLLLHHQQRIQRIEEESIRKDEDVFSFKRQIEHLTTQLSSFKNELTTQQHGHEVDLQKIEDAQSEANALKETNSRLCLVIQEKDFEITAFKEKVATLTRLVEEKSTPDSSSSVEMTRILAESEVMQQKAQQFQQERDQIMMTLNQKQHENKQLHSDLISTREKERRLQHELERLRAHLLEIEENYTQEAIHSEEREKELRNRLAQTEDRIRNATSSYSNASLQANMQVESLQEQLHSIAKQRDEAFLKLDRSEDQVQQLTASLQTFQVVLEQFQQEKERELSNLSLHYEERLKLEIRTREQFGAQIHMLEQKLEEAKEALAAASRLSETLDQREAIISALKREVSDREASLKKIQVEMSKVASSTEGKVDRTIIKNLLVNYFSIPARQQPQVLRIVATVLDFNYEERVKAGLEANQFGGWISNWLGQPKSSQVTGTKQRHPPAGTSAMTTTATATNPTPSLSAAFIQFLETESRPAFSIKMPAESMAQEVTRKADTKNINPFAVTAGTVPHMISMEGNSSHLLMKPMTATLPVFTPVPVSNSNSSIATNVLRDVLKED